MQTFTDPFETRPHRQHITVLETIDELRSYLKQPDKHARFTVASKQAAHLVESITRAGKTPYNSDIVDELWKSLGKALAKELGVSGGSALAEVVFTTRRYVRNLALSNEGYEPFTDAMLHRAHESKSKIEIKFDSMVGQGIEKLVPRFVGGVLRAMKPYSRKYYIQPLGQPARLVGPGAAPVTVG